MKFDLLVNSQLNVKKFGRKPTPDELYQFNVIENWKKISVTPQTLFKLIVAGNSVCGAIKDTVAEDSIKEVTALFIDIDKNLIDLNTILDHQAVKKYACVVHHTASSNLESGEYRLRVVFALACPVSSDIAKAMLIKFQRLFNSGNIEVDKSCINPGRLYYGSLIDEELLIQDKFLPDNFIDESEAKSLLEEYNIKSSEIELNEQRSTEKLLSIWDQIYQDFNSILDDPEYFIEKFFPNINNIGEIRPQRDNVLRQFRGNPTYRQSTSGKSFDIFFNEDKSVTWCDKSNYQNLSGTFVDFYYRYLKGDIYQGIPLNDHEAFWNTLKKIYGEVEIYFDRSKFQRIVSEKRKEELGLVGDIYDYIDFVGKKPIIDERGVTEWFLATHNIFYSTVNKKYYVFNGKFYSPYSQEKTLVMFTNWLESQFDDKENEIFKYAFSLRKIRQIFNNVIQKLEVIENPIKNDSNYINFQNGIFDVRKKELIEHKPEVIHTYVNPYFFDPSGTKLAFFKVFLGKLIPNYLIDDFIKWIACAVSNKGSDINVLLACYGESGSGKTTITNAILDMVTSRDLDVDEINSQSSMENFLAVFGDKNPHGTSNLIGKKLVCFSEMSDFHNLSKSELGRFKDVVGNRKITISYNIKYGSSGTTNLSSAFMLTCENMPELSIDDEGTLRRIFWIPFSMSKEDLSNEFELLFDNNFLSGLLSDLLVLPVDDYISYFSSLEFRNEKMNVREITSGDIYVMFADKYLEPDGESSVTLNELKSSFRVHCMDMDENVRINRSFARKILKAVHILYDISVDHYNAKNQILHGVKLK